MVTLRSHEYVMPTSSVQFNPNIAGFKYTPRRLIAAVFRISLDVAGGHVFISLANRIGRKGAALSPENTQNSFRPVRDAREKRNQSVRWRRFAFDVRAGPFDLLLFRYCQRS